MTRKISSIVVIPFLAFINPSSTIDSITFFIGGNMQTSYTKPEEDVLANINDIVLKGLCSGCKTIAARYIETGETTESIEAAERITYSRI